MQIGYLTKAQATKVIKRPGWFFMPRMVRSCVKGDYHADRQI
jgi:hypothetical protein